jgi:hypothetical protein
MFIIFANTIPGVLDTRDVTIHVERDPTLMVTTDTPETQKVFPQPNKYGTLSGVTGAVYTLSSYPSDQPVSGW